MSVVELKADTPNKNAAGQLGPVCNNCAGYGYTLALGGTGSAGCSHCGQTGIARLDTAQLANMVIEMKAEIEGLKNIILNEIKRTKR